MAKSTIGDIKKLVCVGDGMVAAIGTKGTHRFSWETAISRARNDEINDNRLNMALRWGYAHLGDLADALPRGAVIPLPSEKRAANWLKQNRGPKPGSSWGFESAVEAGFRPRFYLREKDNPYKIGSDACLFWGLERAYLGHWYSMVTGYEDWGDGLDAEARRFLAKIPDWQTRVLVASFIEEPYAPDDPKFYKRYIDTIPLL